VVEERLDAGHPVDRDRSAVQTWQTANLGGKHDRTMSPAEDHLAIGEQ
jgi:hypothetical protein